jgi:predicted N-formylglutamate amidohydrolase
VSGRSLATPEVNRAGSFWVLTCEHASCALPRQYASLGLRRAELRDHIGWDVGARGVQREIARRLGAPQVASRWSRLLVDCNRDPSDPSLILAKSDGIRVPGNTRVSARERRHRLAAYYAPYHVAVDRTLRRAVRARSPQQVRLLALHSFTPVMNGVKRRLDIGVLYDEYPALARRLGRALARAGYRVRYNEPYSGFAGLIYSARRHGNTVGVEYVELEINNALVRDDAGVAKLGRDVAAALRTV